mmetsp:Transcript_25383/g.65593  ORF Transcript_25383/g.65593 Transcript_25383/m.65593 type:complete len:141 (+) Transcript_25383:23-445(+)|eukprot:CAMPEP_0119410548 /NCGR_PEP_ID=MMETSP1335-20130426/3534_1 /TAXON_ID=259385 /ORGANISM="Chrysoculter rhomboideus, Strain RCC1486" /LENGTH=140 /DNA_ID=CAMNT_0007435085 /DNA_START=22 /DNA_END=444 /DNA_ORIENTATION=-
MPHLPHVPSLFSKKGLRAASKADTPEVSKSKTVTGRDVSSRTNDTAVMIDQMIADNEVVVFSKSYCPFCAETKELFQSMGAKAKVVELDAIPNGHLVQAALQQKTRQRTVPNVFVRGAHLGGNDDTQAAYRAGRLTTMLA